MNRLSVGLTPTKYPHGTWGWPCSSLSLILLVCVATGSGHSVLHKALRSGPLPPPCLALKRLSPSVLKILPGSQTDPNSLVQRVPETSVQIQNSVHLFSLAEPVSELPRMLRTDKPQLSWHTPSFTQRPGSPVPHPAHSRLPARPQKACAGP